MPPAALAVAASARAPASRLARARVPRAPTAGSRAPLAPRPLPLPARRAVVAAAADGPHTGIVDEASVHDSSLVSTGLAPRRPASSDAPLCEQIGIQGVHHVAVIVESLQRSMDFYVGLLGLPLNPDRPHDRLPYDGAWLMMGPEMIHLMELPNPDPTNLEFRPEHGGKDRHFCIGVRDLAPLVAALEREGIPYTASRSGRPAIFFRDPDCNTLEVVEGLEWRGEHDRNLTL